MVQRLERSAREIRADHLNPGLGRSGLSDDAERSGLSLDYTHRVFQAWGRWGKKGKNNGAALFVFIQDRKMFIVTGYGAEGALPDATAFDITERNIKPAFRAGHYDRGLTIGVSLICQALVGEYKGTVDRRSTSSKRRQHQKSFRSRSFVFFIIFFYRPH